MDSDAMNKPSGVSGWVNVIVLPDNGNASYVSQLLISSTGVAYVRGKSQTVSPHFRAERSGIFRARRLPRGPLFHAAPTPFERGRAVVSSRLGEGGR